MLLDRTNIKQYLLDHSAEVVGPLLDEIVDEITEEGRRQKVEEIKALLENCHDHFQT
jgi:hypothetical protein